MQNAPGAEEVVARQSAGEAGGAAGGQDVRRAGGVVAQGDGRVIAEENGPGMHDLLGQRGGVLRGNVQVLRGDFIGQPAGFFGIAGENHRAELLEALPGQFAALQAGQLPIEFLDGLIEDLLVPSDQHAGPRGMFGLGDQIQRGVVGPSGMVDDHHDFARPGDGVDVDVAVDVLLGQGHEEVAGPDDLIDPRQALDAIGQGRHGLGAADAIDLVDAQLVAGCQQIGIVGPELRRRGDHGELLHARHLGRHGGHQHRRGIRGRTARHAQADAVQRAIALDQVAAGHLDADVLVQDGFLEIPDSLADAADGGEESGVGPGVGLFQFLWGNADGFGRQAVPGRCGPSSPAAPAGRWFLRRGRSAGRPRRARAVRQKPRSSAAARPR